MLAGQPSGEGVPQRRSSDRTFGRGLSMRWISLAAVCVFGLLIVVAMVLALRTDQHVETNRAAGNAARDFDAISGLVQGQEILIQEYRERPGSRTDFERQTRTVEQTLVD